MMRVWKVLACILCVSSAVAHAEEDEFSIAPLVTLSGGVGFNSDAGASEYFTLGSSQLDYDAHHETKARGVWGLFLGGESEIADDFALQLGVSYYQTASYDADGTLAQGFNSNSMAYYDYNYEIIARQILIESKLLTQWHEDYRPYISLGLGAGINTAQEFSIDYLPSMAMTHIYEDHTTTSFTYNVGIGVDVDLTDYLRLGVGYRFTDFGQVELGQGAYDQFEPTSISETLTQDHFYVQEILVQLTIIK
ncbi:MAG: outer membrane beta-barrel protein [Legionellales bacterium]|jgi:opacity protein-like surface antigen